MRKCERKALPSSFSVYTIKMEVIALENRKIINQKILSWVKEKAETEFAEDIHLIALYGSYLSGTAGKLSDVDFYFIPKTDRGYQLARTFILDGVGYDLYPKTWEQLEEIANLTNQMTPLLGDVEFLFCASDADRLRFEALQEKLRQNLADAALTRQIAIDRCHLAAQYCAVPAETASESAVRKAAGLVMMILADAVAASRGTYYHRGLKQQYQDLCSMSPALPGRIVENYRAIAEAAIPGEAMSQAKSMLENVCSWLDVTVTIPQAPASEEIPAAAVDAPLLAGLYEEISSTFNKIYVCCENGNHILAFLSAVCLQNELDWTRTVGCPCWELLEGYDHRDLSRLAARAKDIEQQLRSVITGNGGVMKDFSDFDSFAASMG